MLIPTKNNVIVRVPDNHGLDVNGIVVPDNVRHRPRCGEVVGVGEAVGDVHVGDLVVISEINAYEYDGLTIVNPRRILGKATKMVSLLEQEHVDYIAPYRDNIIVRKCGRWDDIGDGARGIDLGNGKFLEIPTDVHENTNFAEIIDVGPKCDTFKMRMSHRYRGIDGETIWMPEFADHMECIDFERFEYWILKESLVPTVLFGEAAVHLLKDMVAIELDVSTEQRYKDIEIAEIAQRNVMYGTVIDVGPDGDRLLVGARVMVPYEKLTVKLDSKHVAIMQQKDVWLVIADNT